MKKLILYELKVNMCIETYRKYEQIIEEELLDAMIDVVEKHKSYLGGGIHLVETSEKDYKA